MTFYLLRSIFPHVPKQQLYAKLVSIIPFLVETRSGSASAGFSYALICQNSFPYGNIVPHMEHTMKINKDKLFWSVVILVSLEKAGEGDMLLPLGCFIGGFVFLLLDIIEKEYEREEREDYTEDINDNDDSSNN